MKIFRFYYIDGNQRLYQAENIVEALNYVVYATEYLACEIVKIEEVQ